MRTFALIFFSLLCLPLPAQEKPLQWENQFRDLLPLLGHRNWILVVDMAYPLQSHPAVQTIYTGEDQLTVVKKVLNALDTVPHVYPEVFLDSESDYILEEEAPGMSAYRKALERLLSGLPVEKRMHEALIADVDEAADMFNVLVLKTNMTIPYTSVFLRLNCGYWNADQEQKMRERMKNR